MLKSIDLSKIKKIDIIVTEKMTGRQVYNAYGKPDYLINLALYDMASGDNITYLEDNNKKSGFLFSGEGLGVKDGKPIWCTKDEAYKSDEITDYVSFSPVLVKNGKKDIKWGNKVSSYVNGVHTRCFLGFNDSKFFVGISDYKNSIDSLANYCVKQGMKFAGNNDGNGSCFLMENGKVLVDSSRKNASWLAVYLDKGTTTVTKPSPVNNTSKGTTEIVVAGKKLDMNAFIQNGTTYAPVRAIAEALGKKVSFKDGKVYID